MSALNECIKPDRFLFPSLILEMGTRHVRVKILRKDTWTTDEDGYFRFPTERCFPKVTIASVQRINDEK